MSPPSPPSCLSRSSPCHPHHPCLTSHLRQSISRAFLKQLTDITCFLFSGFHFLITCFFFFYGILFGVKARAGHNIRNRKCANAGIFSEFYVIIFFQKTPPSSGWEFFLSNSLDFVLVWRRRLATMFRAGGANAGQPWRDHSVINAQSSLPPTNFNYFIYNLQLHYLLPARSLSSCIIVQLLTESWTPVRHLGHQRSKNLIYPTYLGCSVFKGFCWWAVRFQHWIFLTHW